MRFFLFLKIFKYCGKDVSTMRYIRYRSASSPWSSRDYRLWWKVASRLGEYGKLTTITALCRFALLQSDFKTDLPIMIRDTTMISKSTLTGCNIVTVWRIALMYRYQRNYYISRYKFKKASHQHHCRSIIALLIY